MTGHGHRSHAERIGAKAAKAFWLRGLGSIILPKRKPVVLYGGLTPTGPGPAKYGITSRKAAERWAEYPEQYGTLLIPLFVTEEYAGEHRELEAVLRDTYDAVAGYEWVEDLRPILRTVEESALLVGRLKLWTPPANFAAEFSPKPLDIPLGEAHSPGMNTTTDPRIAKALVLMYEGKNLYQIATTLGVTKEWLRSKGIS
jgi:hypothetical protein